MDSIKPHRDTSESFGIYPIGVLTVFWSNTDNKCKKDSK